MENSHILPNNASGTWGVGGTQGKGDNALTVLPTTAPLLIHTTYSRNNMDQKCEGNCGLWVLNEMILKTYPENLKKIVGAVWELPAK